MELNVEISDDLRRKIMAFGNEGENFNEVLRRVHDLAVKEQAREFLMSEDGFIPIEKAIEEADKNWQE